MREGPGQELVKCDADRSSRTRFLAKRFVFQVLNGSRIDVESFLVCS
ncbi:hypothetical protein RSSM_01441 [Rhodopirellula sallentina SM41]|uniref:Uncharacterized protein n=1 Tax=Rhodopirellula sallentina SM41 TaxID=1263870 RepID=M5U6Q2_9BACT|nr:hypothetical protein RSSM_01441 [Rhodopirellula sallentina SM41]